MSLCAGDSVCVSDVFSQAKVCLCVLVTVCVCLMSSAKLRFVFAC